MALDNFSHRVKILLDPTQEYVQPSVLVQIFGPDNQLVTERYLAFTVGQDSVATMQQSINDAINEVLDAIDTSEYREDMLDIIDIADTDITAIQSIVTSVNDLSDHIDVSDAARADEVTTILAKIADLRNQPLQLAKLDLVYTQMQDLANLLSSLGSDGSTTRTRVEETKVLAQAITANITTLLSSPVDGKITTALSRLNDIESAITPLYAGQTAISDSVGSILSQSQANGTAVATIKTTATDIKTLVTNLQGSVSENHALDQSLEVDIQDLAASLSTFVTQTATAFDAVNTSLNALATQLTTISNQITALTALHES